MAYSDILGNLPESPVGRDFDVNRPTETFIPTARAVALQPVAFFAALPRAGNYVNPLAFFLVCAEISAILSGLLHIGSLGVAGLIGSIISTLIGGAVGAFIIAGIAHLLVILIVGQSHATFESTFRAVAYASVTSIAAWIPVLGSLISLYGLYLAVIGIREMHKTTTGKAAAVVLIPFAVLVVLGLIFGALIGLAILGLSH